MCVSVTILASAGTRLVVGAVPPAIRAPTPAKPVPVDTPGILLAIGLLLSTAAARGLRRRHVSRR